MGERYSNIRAFVSSREEEHRARSISQTLSPAFADMTHPSTWISHCQASRHFASCEWNEAIRRSGRLSLENPFLQKRATKYGLFKNRRSGSLTKCLSFLTSLTSRIGNAHENITLEQSII